MANGVIIPSQTTIETLLKCLSGQDIESVSLVDFAKNAPTGVNIGWYYNRKSSGDPSSSNWNHTFIVFKPNAAAQYTYMLLFYPGEAYLGRWSNASMVEIVWKTITLA